MQLNVVVTTPSETSTQVIKRLSEWRARGLIGDVVVVETGLGTDASPLAGLAGRLLTRSPETPASDAPPDAPASDGDASDETLAGGSESLSTVELFEHVATNFAEVVELIFVQLQPALASWTPESFAAAERVREALAVHLGPRQRLQSLNLLVPAFGVNDLPSKMAMPTWDSNVMIVPEDRVMPMTGAVPVIGMTEQHVSEAFVTHAALSIATLGGFWAFRPTAPISSPIGVNGGIVAARTFVRWVDADDPVDLAEGVKSYFVHMLDLLWIRHIRLNENSAYFFCRCYAGFFVHIDDYDVCTFAGQSFCSCQS